MIARALALALAALAAPAGAIEVARTASTAERGSIAVSLGGELFLELEGEKVAGAEWSHGYAMSRAELVFAMRYDELLRLQIEPDFGRGVASLRDAFLEWSPDKRFELRAGRVKSPHGYLDNIGRFDLPALSRGLVTDVLRDRLGFGGRALAVMPRVRLRELPLKPWAQGGVFGDFSTDLGFDGAAAVGVRPAKGLDVMLSWHHHAGGVVGGGHGNALSLAVAYDRRFLFAAIEGHLARSILLRRDGRAATEDATLWAARALVSVPIALPESLTLAPFAGGAILDPQLGAGDDLGFELQGGVQLRWLEVVMLGLEATARLGQPDFVFADQTRLVAFVGASL